MKRESTSLSLNKSIPSFYGRFAMLNNLRAIIEFEQKQECFLFKSHKS